MSVSKAVSNLVIEVFNHIENAKNNENAGDLQESHWFKEAAAQLDEAIEQVISERIAAAGGSGNG